MGLSSSETEILLDGVSICGEYLGVVETPVLNSPFSNPVMMETMTVPIR